MKLLVLSLPPFLPSPLSLSLILLLLPTLLKTSEHLIIFREI